MSFIIKQLGKNDLLIFQKLVQLFNEVFEEEKPSTANELHLNNLLAKKEFIALVAVQDNIVIGGVTAYEMPMYTHGNSELYIYDMAIDAAFQRMGIGKKLIDALTEYCRLNNIINMFVEAHEEDKHAVDFYKSANGKIEKVVHFNFEIK